MGKPTRETDTDMFDDVREQIVQIPILEETYQDILQMCLENEWEEEEGLRTVLAYGLGYLQGERELARLNVVDGADLAAELQAKVEELSSYHSMYAVMKFKAFKLQQVARTLEMNVAGLRGELAFYQSAPSLLREQISQLQEENARLRERLAASPPDEPIAETLAAAHTQRPPMSAMLSRIAKWLQRRKT